ncbi:MAG: HD-GYP domain-containing protein [Dehalococcoidia bacterium]
MASSATIETATAGFLDAVLYEGEDSRGLQGLTRATLLAPLSTAFDLAEGRPAGHAQRVAYIGVALAEELGLSQAEVAETFFACLLHDAGMAALGASHGRGRGNDDLVPPAGGWGDVIRALTVHCDQGDRIARRLGFGENVATAVARHHDCWDGSGPSGQNGNGQMPVIARIVAAADRFECIIDSEPSPLVVRRRGPALVRDMSGSEVDPEVASRLAGLAAKDSFWLGFYDRDMSIGLMAMGADDALSTDGVLELLGAMSDIVDSRNSRELGRGRRVSDLAVKVALASGLTERRAELVRAAALLQDIGTLAVPASVLSKPDILTLDEMMQMQMHPAIARNIVGEIPGMGAIAWWVGCHHERVDGKGYPGMLEGESVPIEAQVIGIAEAYEALTNNRPYRRALAADDAAEVLRGLADTRFHATVIRRLEEVVATKA